MHVNNVNLFTSPVAQVIMTSMRGGGSDLVQRLNAITEVEKSIGNLLRHAQTCISELSKEKQISKVCRLSSTSVTMVAKLRRFIRRFLDENGGVITSIQEDVNAG
ncbi:unnamed protein product [Strongylus vulgaris]|uniref:Uncharacterized protein n=1 Tax=Strongylus vulgaris TaxID=40348 RepID=A0A3P7JWH3_STRVU|nr:unnamed protein product [Strongylus vulgaris]